MKYILISAAHYKRAPYVEDYIMHFKKNSVDFELCYWDRTKIDTEEEIDSLPTNYKRYQNKKNEVQAGLIDYIKYSYFASSNFRKYSNRKDVTFIIFTVQLQFIINPFLNFLKLDDNLIFDIRDFHQLSQKKMYKKIFKKTKANVISSEGFKKWLPSNNNIIVKHNVTMFDLAATVKSKVVYLLDVFYSGNLVIGHVGSLSHFAINSKIVEENRLNIHFSYYGDGLESRKYEVLSTENFNVSVHGRYDREDEGKLYRNFHMTNLMLDNSDYNTRTVMANRLYSSLIYLRPSICFAGSYLADQVEKFGLGIVITSKENFNDEFEEKLNIFCETENFRNNAKNFLKMVEESNKEFYDYFL